MKRMNTEVKKFVEAIKKSAEERGEEHIRELETGTLYEGFTLSDVFNPPEGFKIMDIWCEYPYKMTWKNEEENMFFTYVEGDLQLLICKDKEHFEKEIEEMTEYAKKHYKEYYEECKIEIWRDKEKAEYAMRHELRPMTDKERDCLESYLYQENDIENPILMNFDDWYNEEKAQFESELYGLNDRIIASEHPLINYFNWEQYIFELAPDSMELYKVDGHEDEHSVRTCLVVLIVEY
jgi:hypothetical protein